MIFNNKLDIIFKILECFDYDEQTNTLLIKGDFNIEVEGNCTIKARKDLHIKSNTSDAS
jgi:hypothetical protein